MRKYLIYGTTLAFTWIFVTGSPDLPTFVQGLFFGLPVSFAFRRFYPGDMSMHRLEKLPYLIEYCGIFVESLIISNIDVAQRLLRPSKSVNPEIIEYSTGLEHPTAVAMLADSITLTPGTLVVDHIEEENKLVIHCLNGNCTEQTKKDIRGLENLLKRIFG
ncbi:Na+/H+ antiporter subunit E [Candidatus Nanosalina sp. VS9-1]|uniref:Na+/H+ antiporter subunit E n=1 Tax=Candidatus Nanosalina sp. VS9-1 TaxID=3388566 RepID=UPI0039E1F353